MMNALLPLLVASWVVYSPACPKPPVTHNKTRPGVSFGRVDVQDQFAETGSVLNGCSFSCAISDTSVTAGLPVAVTITLRNESTVMQSFQNIDPERDFRLNELDQNGNIVGLTNYGHQVDQLRLAEAFGAHDNFGGPLVNLSPGETKTFRMTASRIYDMTMPGQYTIICKYPFVLPDGKSLGELISDPVRVSVTEPSMKP